MARRSSFGAVVGQRQMGAMMDRLFGQGDVQGYVQRAVAFVPKITRVNRAHLFTQVGITVHKQADVVWVFIAPGDAQGRSDAGFLWQPRGLAPFQRLGQCANIGRARGILHNGTDRMKLRLRGVGPRRDGGGQ